MKTTQVKKMMVYTSTRHESRCKAQTSSTNATEDNAADNPSGNSVAAETSVNSIPLEATARKCPNCQVDFPASYFFHHLRSCNTRRRPQAFLSKTPKRTQQRTEQRTEKLMTMKILKVMTVMTKMSL